MRLVHLAPASSERSIDRVGLRGRKWIVDSSGRRAPPKLRLRALFADGRAQERDDMAVDSITAICR